MKTLLFGKDGQLGQEFISSINSCSELLAVGKAQCDLSQPEQIQTLIHQFKPDLIINASAYTAVDLAQTESELASLVNTQAPTVMAKEAARLGAALVHYSTDYVFDGLKKGEYTETDPCAPLSVYGQSKYLGELGVAEHCKKHLIFRTSWVFSAHGNNFLKTILKLASLKQELKVINDQCGAPTSAALLVDSTMAVLAFNGVIQGSADKVARSNEDSHWGLFNMVASGFTNWHAYAQYLVTKAMQLGLGSGFTLDATKISAIPSKDYPQPAPRPLNSRLSTEKLRTSFHIELPEWRECVDQELQKIKNSQLI